MIAVLHTACGAVNIVDLPVLDNRIFVATRRNVPISMMRLEPGRILDEPPSVKMRTFELYEIRYGAEGDRQGLYLEIAED